MAVSVNWDTKVISVPKLDLTLVGPGEVYQYDLDAFRLELKGLEAGEEGLPFLDTHSHNAPVAIAGVTLARVLEIINGYTVTWEDGQYAVNLIGANSNVADTSNVNQVSIRPQNSAGLIQIDDAIARGEYEFVDQRVYAGETLKSARRRLFLTAGDLSAATYNAAGLEGAFASFRFTADDEDGFKPKWFRWERET